MVVPNHQRTRLDHRDQHRQRGLEIGAVHVADHAAHFLKARVTQIEELGAILDRPPLVIAPYDAELFGHWWYEGPDFLDRFVRQAGLVNAVPSSAPCVGD